MKDVYILSVESSCDETSIAIVKNGKEVVALEVFTQIDTHALYGGVVPEIASRMHTESILFVLDNLIKKSSFDINNIDAIAVTYAPGLLGSLLVGIEFAKTLGWGLLTILLSPLLLICFVLYVIYTLVVYLCYEVSSIVLFFFGKNFKNNDIETEKLNEIKNAFLNKKNETPVAQPIYQYIQVPVTDQTILEKKDGDSDE